MGFKLTWPIIIGVLGFVILVLILAPYLAKAGIPWSGPHFATYEMSNRHLYYLYPINTTTIFVYDADWKEGWYFHASRGNEGPFISTKDGFRWVLQWHGDTISIERVPNNTGLQPDYYLIGNKIPNDYHTRSYKGTFVLTNRKMGGPAFEGELPPGVLGQIKIQPTGKDFWLIMGEKAVLFQKELDNGFNAYTYNGVLSNGNIVKIIFYDSVNFQMLVGLKDGRVIPINGTRV